MELGVAYAQLDRSLLDRSLKNLSAQHRVDRMLTAAQYIGVYCALDTAIHKTDGARRFVWSRRCRAHELGLASQGRFLAARRDELRPAHEADVESGFCAPESDPLAEILRRHGESSLEQLVHSCVPSWIRRR